MYERGFDMPKYLFSGSYTTEGVKGVLKDTSVSRREVIGNIISDMGGTMEAFYFAMGDDDVICIADLPDQETAIGLSLVVNAAGGAAIKTTLLLTPEEVDEAGKKTINYRPPGQ